MGTQRLVEWKKIMTHQSLYATSQQKPIQGPYQGIHKIY